jgi:hypothetical protein
MKPTPPTAHSSKFARYAAASAAALGAAAAAEAQTSGFSGTYLLTPNVGNTYGVWTAGTAGVLSNGSANVDISSAPTSLTLGLNAATVGGAAEQLSFLTTAQATGFASFTLNVSSVDGGSLNPNFYFTPDNATFYSLSLPNYTYGFGVSAGATFGFRLNIGYSGALGGIQGVVTNFSAPAAAIPEPGAAGLLAACAAAGFVALIGLRKARLRAA